MNGSTDGTITLRLIQEQDDESVRELIRAVMAEYHADAEGFSVHDPEVDAMSRAYFRGSAEYWVVEESGRVRGGGGIAPLRDGGQRICELRKMYFDPLLRGRGWGRRLLEHLIARARAHGFEQMYAESYHTMVEAARLYEAAGFVPLCEKMGNTGHSGCDRYLALRI